MRAIRKIVIHCSDTEDSRDFTARDIKDWHTMAPPMGNGWSDIGYHWVIRRDGTLEAGRAESIKGAHVRGHNSDSIGICWVGRNQLDPRQFETMKKKIRGLLNKYKLTIFDIYGHKELNQGKTCPNLDMDWVRAEVAFTLEEI